MDANQAKIWAEIKTIQDDMKEDMKPLVGSLASRIDTNEEKMKEKLNLAKRKCYPQ
jgi:hypothetical protein